MKKNISKFIVLVMLLLVSFLLPVQAIEHDIIIRLQETKNEITTKHIECINIESKNQLDVEKNFNIVLELVDYKGKVLNYVTSEETLEGKESGEIKAYTKILPEAYKVRVFAYDNLNNKNTISNIVDIPIVGGYFVEEIISIDDLSGEVDQRSPYNLPKEVLAKFNTGATKKVPVKWNVTSVDTSKAGNFTFEGKVEGYSEKVKFNLTIKKIDVVVKPEDIVKFENAELEAIIRKKIKKEDADISKNDLLKIKELNLAWELYTDLNINDLKYFKNLEALDLSFCDENFDLTPISNLTKLKSLNLFNNAIEDINPLQSLTSLTELNLATNKITNVEALKNLTNLTKLQLNGNKITDIKALSNLVNLVDLKLGGNKITDYSPTKLYYNKLKHKDFELKLEPVEENPNDIVKFENAELEAIIREEIKKEEGDILGSYLLKIKELNLSYSLYGDTNINDLRHLTNLETLDLSFNSANLNLLPLANLTKLKSLNLFGNAIDDISSLQGLTTLTDLNLGANNITNIEALRNLTNLTKLKLTDNPITDYSPTKSYYDKLMEKDFKLNLSEEEDKVIKFTDINLEKAVRKAIDKDKGEIHCSDVKELKELNVLGVGVYSLSGIENLKALEKLSLWANNIENSQLKYLKNLSNLKKLDLAKNRLTYIPANAFENMSQLEELVLDENQITEIHKDAFKGLNNLKNLLIEENKISNIEAVRGLKNLQSLFIRYNKITDITPVEELIVLKDFWGSNNNISNISSLGNLKELNWIELDNNNVLDISALGNCNKVTRIKIGKNKIKNIDVVSNMKNLEWLEAENNKIEDINCVSELVNLSILNLKKNNITKVEALRKLEKLTQLYLSENNISDFSPVAGYFDNIKRKDFELK